MAAQATQAAAFSVGHVLARSLAVLVGNPLPFLLTALLLLAPFYLAILALLEPHGQPRLPGAAADLALPLLLVLGPMACYGLPDAALVDGTLRALREPRAVPAGSVLRGLLLLPRVFAVIGLQLLAILLGLVALLVPGLLLLTALWVAVPIAVVERPGALASLHRSAILSHGIRWRVFKVILAALLPAGLLSASADALLAQAWPGPDGAYARVLASWGLQSLFAAFVAVVTTVCYRDLRVAKEGIDVARPAAAAQRSGSRIET